jgi:hypothetical protein
VRTGQLETQLALDDLLQRAENEEWTAKARDVMSALCLAGVNFTAETVREQMLADPPSANLLGAVFRAAASEGWITHVGYVKARRPDAHARILTLWRSAS